MRFLTIPPMMVVALAACAEAPTPPPGGADAGAGADSEVPDGGIEHDAGVPDPIPFAACTDGISVWPDQACATVKMPLRHGTVSDRTLDIFVKKVPATAERKRQLWILEGGPGTSPGTYLEPQFAELGPLFADAELFILDQRGTGASSLLECPPYGTSPAADQVAACADTVRQLGDDLEAYSTTEVAQDLGTLIERTRASSVPVFVYGRSYATYVLLRYLHLFPRQADGVVLDSLCPPPVEGETPHCMGPGFDARFNEVFNAFLLGCAEDATCNHYLGTNPPGFVGRVLTKLEQQSCPVLKGFGVDDIEGRMLLANLFQIRARWPTIAPFLYRALRCNADDQAAITHYLRDYLRFTTPIWANSTERKSSDVLKYTVKFSEVRIPDGDWPSEEDAVRGFLAARAALGGGVDDYLGRMWPKYAVADDLAGWPSETPPLLILHGDMDPQTPVAFARAAEQRFTAAHQQVVIIPRQPHVQVHGMGGTPTCGATLMAQFLASPRAPVDKGCVDQVPPIDYAGTSLDPERVFGTTSLWDGP